MDDDSRYPYRFAIRLFKNRMAELSDDEEDPTKIEQFIREYQNLIQSLKEKEKEEKYVDLKLLEKKRVVNVIMDLLKFDDDKHRQSAFTPDLLDKLEDVGDPILLLTDDDLKFIYKSVGKLFECNNYYYWKATLRFCDEAKTWLDNQVTDPEEFYRPYDYDDDVDDDDDDDDDDYDDEDDEDVAVFDHAKIIYLWHQFNYIISLRDEKVQSRKTKLSKDPIARARDLDLVRAALNNPHTNTVSNEESRDSDDEEEQEKSHILERDRKEEFYDGHGRVDNLIVQTERLRTSDEEQQEKSFVPMSSKFEHDGAMLGCYDATETSNEEKKKTECCREPWLLQ